MAATTQWTEYNYLASTSLTANTNQTISGTGRAGYVEGSSTISGVVSVTAGVTDQIQVALNGGGFQQITLSSGVNLDARAVARDISYKLKQLPGAEFDHIVCEYENNKFRIYSGLLGTTSSVTITSGTNDVRHLLGMAASQNGPNTVNTVNGTASANNGAYTGQVTTSGTYVGQLDDIYQVYIGTTHPIADPTPSGGNTYAGTAASNGFWNEATTETYTVTINTTNGSTMNGGAGNVPTFTVTSTQGDNVAVPVEILFSNYFYEVGTKGLRIKFSDAPFGNNDKFTIVCTAIAFAQGASTAAAVGSAQYHWSSLRDGKSSAPTTTQVTGTAVGNRGVTIAFSNSGSLTRRDVFRIHCSGPQPQTLGVTTLNFGAVTVSTYSPTKVVTFDIKSGATLLSDPKFGLFSNGTLSHHNQGNADTLFAFGKVGGGSPSSNGSQWHAGVMGNTDLASDTPPVYLAATEDNLPEITTADSGKSIGIYPGEMLTDFIFLAIKLGSAETGAAVVAWRMWYNYS